MTVNIPATVYILCKFTNAIKCRCVSWFTCFTCHLSL